MVGSRQSRLRQRLCRFCLSVSVFAPGFVSVFASVWIFAFFFVFVLVVVVVVVLILVFGFGFLSLGLGLPSFPPHSNGFLSFLLRP